MQKRGAGTISRPAVVGDAAKVAFLLDVRNRIRMKEHEQESPKKGVNYYELWRHTVPVMVPFLEEFFQAKDIGARAQARDEWLAYLKGTGTFASAPWQQVRPAQNFGALNSAGIIP